MLDRFSEHLRLLTQAPRDLPGRPHISTLVRWWRRGVRGVKLETILIGGRRYTSLEALTRFFDRLTEAREAPPVVPPGKARRHAIQAVDEKLDKLGI
jgi:hypothetical protein